MKCPACKGPLREKGAGGMTLDVCYGGCGGIWFDSAELERLDSRAATTLHTVWQAPPHKKVVLTEPRLCPRCPDLVLDRRWFSELEKVEIDQCPKCGGIWLDAGEFTRIYDEIKGAKLARRSGRPPWRKRLPWSQRDRPGNNRQQAEGVMFDRLFDLLLAITGPGCSPRIIPDFSVTLGTSR